MKTKYTFFLIFFAFLGIDTIKAQNLILEEHWVETNGTVRTIVIDSVNHWIYLGGDFTMVGDSARNRIARLDTNGQISSWNPNADNSVFTIVLKGDTVFASGSFTNIGGKSHNYIASIDGKSDTAFHWYPNPNNIVRTMIISNNILYIGGDFTSYSSLMRNHIAAFNLETGAVTGWNPNANNNILVLHKVGVYIYAGGYFSMLGGIPRYHLAAIHEASGSTFAVNSAANTAINVFASNSGTLFAGGPFTNIFTTPRNRLASINITSSHTITSWNPNANNAVNAIVLNDSILFAGGDFTTIGGLSYGRLASFNINTGLVTSWNPNADKPVLSLAYRDKKLYVGGEFSKIDGKSRNGFAVFFDPSCYTSFSVDSQTLCDSYTWIDGNTYTTSNNTAKYILTNSGGCDSVISLKLTIHKIDTSVTQNGSLLTARQSFVKYQWLDCGKNYEPISGEIGRTFQTTKSGSYAVEIKNDFCTDTSFCFKIENAGVDENNLKAGIKVYPNPSTGEFNIELKSKERVAEVMVSNTLGQQVYNNKFIDALIISFNIAEEKGIYFVYIILGDNKPVIFKVILI